MKLEKANLKRSPHFVPDHKKILWVFWGQCGAVVH